MHVSKSISTNAQYVTLHWKSSTASTFISQIPVIPLQACLDPEIYSAFQSSRGALEHSDEHSQNHIYWVLPVSNWVDSLIAPSGLLFSSLPPACSSSSFSSMNGVVKKWMWETYLLHGHILSIGGDALRFEG
jgi:hypothetical protein